jgi:D-hexose-6-phosphate mutarotase
MSKYYNPYQIHLQLPVRVVVHEFGTSVLSFQTAGRECLFLSRSKLDGSNRSGYSLVFPIFGPPTDEASSMPQHVRKNVGNSTVVAYDTAKTAGIECSLALA